MYLTAHSSAGVLIAAKFVNPWLAFVLGFLSHYVLDMIPHGEENIFDKKYHRINYRSLIKALTIDFIILILYIYFIMTKLEVNQITLLAAVFGTVLPDLIWGFYYLTKWKILKWPTKMHNYLHMLIKHRQLPLSYGLVIQSLTLIVFTLIAFSI